ATRWPSKSAAVSVGCARDEVRVRLAAMVARSTHAAGESTASRPAALLAVTGEGVDVEDGRIELDPPVEPRGGARRDAGDGGAVHLDVLRDLVRHVGTLVVVDLAAGPGRRDGVPCHHLERVQQLTLPREFAVPGTLIRHRVDVELELAEEIVLVAR